MNLQKMANCLQATCQSDQAINRFVIDSRQVQPGDVFVALPGQHQHGSQFIEAAAQAGAVAAMTDIDHLPTKSDPSIPIFAVDDALEALTTLARKHRQAHTCPGIALTGSNGKTSVKEMIYAALPKPALATEGNYNNHIGVPLTLLRLKKEHRFAVFELGANHQGEIAHTVRLVKPKVTLINNIGPAHIEGFGSIDGVAQAKGEIYTGLNDDGIAIINDDDAYHHYWDKQVLGKKTIRFSIHHPADVFAHSIHINSQQCAQFTIQFPEGEQAEITLQVPGRHCVANALAAASCLYALNIATATIAAGLNQFKGVRGRFNRRNGRLGCRLIDDSYNANPESVKRAIETLANYDGERILVMGDMGELGQNGRQHHREIGQFARQLGIDKVYTIGQLCAETSSAFGAGGHHFTEFDELIHMLNKTVHAKQTLLIKGSRSAKMERIVDALIDNCDMPEETS